MKQLPKVNITETDFLQDNPSVVLLGMSPDLYQVGIDHMGSNLVTRTGRVVSTGERVSNSGWSGSYSGERVSHSG